MLLLMLWQTWKQKYLFEITNYNKIEYLIGMLFITKHTIVYLTYDNWTNWENAIQASPITAELHRYPLAYIREWETENIDAFTHCINDLRKINLSY